MALQITQGAVLTVALGEPATYDAAGFSTLLTASGEAIGSIESFGEFGANAVITEFTSVDDAIVQKFVGAMNAGDLALGLGRDITDTGQALFAAAMRPSDASYGATFSAGITYKDGSIQYFTHKISSYTTNPSDVNSVIRAATTLAINNEVLDA